MRSVSLHLAQWGVWPFDFDLTFGLISWQSTQDAAPDRIGWVMRTGTRVNQDLGISGTIHHALQAGPACTLGTATRRG